MLYFTFLQLSALASKSSTPEISFSKMELSRNPLEASGSMRASDLDNRSFRFTAKPGINKFTTLQLEIPVQNNYNDSKVECTTCTKNVLGRVHNCHTVVRQLRLLYQLQGVEYEYH